jgi:two-component system sensor histidine kinase KdpD
VVAAWVTWLLILIFLTIGLLAIRNRVQPVHAALVFLLVVLGGSASGGRTLGLLLSALAFVGFHYFFVPYRNSLVLADPFDWVVLAAFLVTSIVAAHLLARADRRAKEASERAAEVERLAVMGAEALNAGRADEALRRIEAVIRDALGVAHCEIHDLSAADAPAEEGPRSLVLPLSVHGARVGSLRLRDDEAIPIAPGRRRFVDALGYYAALGLERARLTAEAERAEAYRQADALKASLIATLSHDLRTPLTTIKGLGAKLSERGLPEARTIEEEADRLSRLVTDLLDLSRLNARTLPMRPELNTASDLVGATIQRIGGAAVHSRVRIAADTTGVPELAGTFDLAHSVRALGNLVENALKYSPADTRVELRLGRTGHRLAFHVADRGPGVPDGEQERIFEPFYRAPGAPPDVGGAGLGLAIARRLAVEQGGSVVYSPRSGGGSVFTLLLPAADVPADLDAMEARGD